MPVKKKVHPENRYAQEPKEITEATCRARLTDFSEGKDLTQAKGKVIY